MTRKGPREIMLEGLDVPTKIRKRGCSSSPSSSSRIYNYRFNKRAILVGKSRAGLVVGLGRSRSTTPVPIWRTTPLRSAIETPKYSQSGKSTRPVSARRLAATLWEMNEMPSPKMSERSDLEVMKRQHKKNVNKMTVKAERLHSGSGSLPPHLSDPPHSPTVSEKKDRSGTGSRRRRTPSISQKLMSADRNGGAIDSISNASFMEVSSESVVGGKSRLRDISSALTTSKELLKIISRIWAQADQPSSSTSLISALHAELERARLQVNQLVQEQKSDQNQVNYLMKCFAEEKLALEAAMESNAHELEGERKSRRRLESLNAKLGKELAEMKSSFMKAVEELEGEKRTRELTEQVCDELARNFHEDRAAAEKMKMESVRVHKERAHTALSEAKHQFEEKNSAIGKLRKQLEVFLGPKRDKEEAKATYSSKHIMGLHLHEGEDDGEVEDGVDSKRGDSAESDLHSIELDLKNKNNPDNEGRRWACTSGVDRETKARISISGQVSRRSASLQRGEEGFHEADKVEEMQRLKSAKDLKSHLSRLGREGHCLSPKEQPWLPRDPCQERASLPKPRAAEGSRRSK